MRTMRDMMTAKVCTFEFLTAVSTSIVHQRSMHSLLSGTMNLLWVNGLALGSNLGRLSLIFRDFKCLLILCDKSVLAEGHSDLNDHNSIKKNHSKCALLRLLNVYEIGDRSSANHFSQLNLYACTTENYIIQSKVAKRQQT